MHFISLRNFIKQNNYSILKIQNKYSFTFIENNFMTIIQF